ncbi:isochorismatase family protein [Pseudomonas violetae]|uniref:Isochorismatase family protein n=1 Tax=Pseudomonas violetae TaxID=2915813 RepID=A0ABT0ETF3_9PSED|nr:isochorismatase family protein [Pseudomonas violetae]MCK1789019.1 isochorismatase family protein [Pseudomonas violetae]
MSLDSRTLSPAQRYALVLVDLSVGFTDPLKSPLASECIGVVEANRKLLAAFRSRGLPVIFTTVAYDKPSQARVFREKIPALNVLVAGSELTEIDSRVAPMDGEPVLVKFWASGFFGTDLAQRLRGMGADGVMITGLTTSGCVRATVLDALQNEFRVIVPEQAVGDRDAQAHRANLRDLQIKYADVRDLDDCLALLG